jgi:hypothetical protein
MILYAESYKATTYGFQFLGVGLSAVSHGIASMPTNKPQTLADRIRQIHAEQNATRSFQPSINDLSNEELIDLISQADEEHYVARGKTYDSSNSVDPEWDDQQDHFHGYGLLGGNE